MTECMGRDAGMCVHACSSGARARKPPPCMHHTSAKVDAHTVRHGRLGERAAADAQRGCRRLHPCGVNGVPCVAQRAQQVHKPLCQLALAGGSGFSKRGSQMSAQARLAFRIAQGLWAGPLPGPIWQGAPNGSAGGKQRIGQAHVHRLQCLIVGCTDTRELLTSAVAHGSALTRNPFNNTSVAPSPHPSSPIYSPCAC